MAQSVQQALAFLQEKGLTLTADQEKDLADSLEKEMVETAEVTLQEKMATDDSKVKVRNATRWAKEMFSLADKVEREIVSRERNQGRGAIVERVFTIETPHGTFKVSLTQTK